MRKPFSRFTKREQASIDEWAQHARQQQDGLGDWPPLSDDVIRDAAQLGLTERCLAEWDQKTLAAIRSGELTHLDLATQHQHLTRMSRQLANGAPYEPAYRDEAAESVIDMLKEALGKNKDGK